MCPLRQIGALDSLGTLVREKKNKLKETAAGI